tara:strand:+ start:250 stop:372 length:123 start_codon:yes stop_codon:yes gene_type:complete
VVEVVLRELAKMEQIKVLVQEMLKVELVEQEQLHILQDHL